MAEENFYLNFLTKLSTESNINLNTFLNVLKDFQKYCLKTKTNDWKKLIQFFLLTPNKVSLIDVVFIAYLCDLRTIFSGEFKLLNKFFYYFNNRVIVNIINGDFIFCNLQVVRKEITVTQEIFNDFSKILQKLYDNGSTRFLMNIDAKNDCEGIIKEKFSFNKKKLYGNFKNNKNITRDKEECDNIIKNGQIPKINNALIKISTFDIDGIYGPIFIHDIDDIFKTNINVSINLNSKMRILNRTYQVLTNNGPKYIKKLFNIYIGYVNTEFGEIKMFLGFNQIYQKKNTDFLNKVWNELKIEISSFYHVMINYSTDLKSLKSFREADILIKETENKYIINMELNSKCFAKLLMNIRKNKNLKDFSPFLYIELFNTKTVFSFDHYSEALTKFNHYFNLENFNFLNIDLCMELNYDTNERVITSATYDSLNNKIFNCFTIFGCKSLTNFNKNFITNQGDYIKCIYHGIYKMNVYSSIISTLIPKLMLKSALPEYSISHLVSNYFGVKLINKGIKDMKLYTDACQKLINNCEKFKNFNFPYRLECTINITNIFDIISFISKIKNKMIFTATETNRTVSSLKLNTIKLLKRVCEVSTNYDSYFYKITNEILLKEYFIKGGKNIHILPRIIQKEVNELINENNVSNNFFNEEFLNCLEHVDKVLKEETMMKAIYYSKILNSKSKEKIYDFIQFMFKNSELEAAEFILKNWLGTCTKYYDLNETILFGLNVNQKYIKKEIINVIDFVQGYILKEIDFERKNKKELNYNIMANVFTKIYPNSSKQELLELLTQYINKKGYVYIFLYPENNMQYLQKLKSHSSYRLNKDEKIKFLTDTFKEKKIINYMSDLEYALLAFIENQCDNKNKINDYVMKNYASLFYLTKSKAQLTNARKNYKKLNAERKSAIEFYKVRLSNIHLSFAFMIGYMKAGWDITITLDEAKALYELYCFSSGIDFYGDFEIVNRLHSNVFLCDIIGKSLTITRYSVHKTQNFFEQKLIGEYILAYFNWFNNNPGILEQECYSVNIDKCIKKYEDEISLV